LVLIRSYRLSLQAGNLWQGWYPLYIIHYGLIHHVDRWS